MDNWNNDNFLQQLFQKNSIIENENKKRIEFKAPDVVIDGFKYDTSSKKRTFCCHARLCSGDIVEILEENEDKTIQVKDMLTSTTFSILAKDVVVPLIETFLIKKTSLTDFSVSTLFIDSINVTDMA